MQHVQVVDGGQSRAARVRVDAEDVEVVAAPVGGGEQRAGEVELQRDQGGRVGGEVGDDRIVAGG